MSTGTRTPLARGPVVTLMIDGKPTLGYAGEMLAGVLLVAGVHAFRRTVEGRPRAAFCGMGSCLDCAVRVDGVPMVRSCLTPVAEGMAVDTGETW